MTSEATIYDAVIQSNATGEFFVAWIDRERHAVVALSPSIQRPGAPIYAGTGDEAYWGEVLIVLSPDVQPIDRPWGRDEYTIVMRGN